VVRWRLAFAILIFAVGCDSAASNNPDAAGAKRLFVTKNTYPTSNLTGVCAKDAQAAGLQGAWIEWLSSSASNTALDRVQGPGPWKLLNGTIAFQNRAQLQSTPSVMINVTEDGTAIDPMGVGNKDVWTGTAVGGGVSDNCAGWTSTLAGAARTGLLVVSDSRWTDVGDQSCNQELHVYCFEQ
jgi:hypothetical protein